VNWVTVKDEDGFLVINIAKVMIGFNCDFYVRDKDVLNPLVNECQLNIVLPRLD
jgi:hypothetical protein